MKILLLFAFVFLDGYCTWIKPVTLLTDKCTFFMCWASSIYFDPASRVSHIFFVRQAAKTNYYFAVSDNGTVLHSLQILDYHWAWKGIIRGDGDGKHIYMVFTFYRDYRGGGLGDNNFTESFDGGKTWTEMMTLPHEDPNDGLFRSIGEMLLIKETKRIFIIYGLDEAIGMVTRPPNSQVFSQEKIILKVDQHRNDFAGSTYTIDKGQMILHIFFTNTKGELRHSKSENNGQIWSKPILITNQVDDEIMVIDSVPSLSNNIFAAFTTYGYYPTKLVYSNNQGKNFSLPISLTEQYGKRAEFSIGLSECLIKKPVVLSYAIVGEKYKVEYYMWDTELNNKQKLDHPFEKNNVGRARMDCYGTKDNSTVVLAVTTNNDKTGVVELKFSLNNLYL